MKSDEEIMEILEAYDLTGSCRAAANLAGCSHHSVAGYVAAREEGRLTPGRAQPRPMLIDAFLPKVEEWVDSSRGKIRADVVHDKLQPLGYAGSERTTRRAVEQVKRAWRAGNRRVHRPWAESLVVSATNTGRMPIEVDWLNVSRREEPAFSVILRDGACLARGSSQLPIRLEPQSSALWEPPWGVLRAIVRDEAGVDLGMTVPDARVTSGARLGNGDFRVAGT